MDDDRAAQKRFERAAGYRLKPRVYFGECATHGRKLLAGFAPARSPEPRCPECREPFLVVSRT